MSYLVTSLEKPRQLSNYHFYNPLGSVIEKSEVFFFKFLLVPSFDEIN